jgi:hypothetical protein
VGQPEGNAAAIGLEDPDLFVDAMVTGLELDDRPWPGVRWDEDAVCDDGLATSPRMSPGPIRSPTERHGWNRQRVSPSADRAALPVASPPEAAPTARRPGSRTIAPAAASRSRGRWSPS